MIVRFTPEARADLLEAKAFYGAAAPRLRRAFAAEVRWVLVRLTRHPRSGAPYEEGTRRVLLAGFPYSIIYEPATEIVAVIHPRRGPGIWHDRLSGA